MCHQRFVPNNIFTGLPVVSATDVIESYHAYTKLTSRKRQVLPVFASQEAEACSVRNCGELKPKITLNRWKTEHVT